jgi:Rrf2 family iron-sulfur cluster assembly transcriptional regulator
MIRTSQTQYQMLRICAFQNRAFFARNVTGITKARAQPCKQWGRDGFHLSGRDIMSDGPSFIESIPYERIRKLRPAGGTKHDNVRVLEGRRKPLLPDKAILAIAVVADVAVHSRDGRVTGGMLAKRRGLSPRYLEPMLQALVHLGVLKGVRGPHGGYKLGRDRDRISAGDILRAAVDETRRESGARASRLDQALARAIAQVEEVFSEALARISLEELTGSQMRNRGE